MTGTIVDALQDATTALNNATANVLGLQETLTQQASASQTAATTVINNFQARPAVQYLWVDPVNGNDANDGSTYALAKKSLDNLLDTIGISATIIFLTADTTLLRRHGINASLAIYGVQPDASAAGYDAVQRNFTFLGTALNSPQPVRGNFPSGLDLIGPNFFTQNINLNLPDLPANSNVLCHIENDSGGSVRFNGTILNVTSAAAGSLLGGNGNTMNVRDELILGPGVQGHIFQGVAAGENPNDLFVYDTNCTSA